MTRGGVVLALATLLLAAAGCRVRPTTPLAEAAARGDPDAVRSLLARGADVDGKDGEGWTALDWASRQGQTAVMGALLDAGAAVDLRDDGNAWTALMHALHKDQHTAARLLMDRGADVNARAPGGITPLMIATGDYETEGSAEMVRELIEMGADPYARAEWGGTALVNAVAWGRTEIVKALLEKAPGLKLPDDLSGTVALYLARWRGREEILSALRHAGAIEEEAEARRR